MTLDALATPALPGDVSTAWRTALQQQLRPLENVLATLEVDLDARLHFVSSLLVVTSERILASGDGREWQQWNFEAGLSLQHHDHGGVGHLNLTNPRGLLATWRFTLGQNLHAIRFVESFDAQLESHVSGKPLAMALSNVCPSCKAPLEPDQEECPICTKVVHTPPSTWTLFRLWRFAKPYRGQLLLGFVLMLLGTAASQVPPYLTIPLVDKVLIPFQNGQHIEPSTIAWYLAGLLGAGVMAWILSWAKTYILALASERIAADLRTTTYEHLMRLSLEYFGGKRTGDLLSRVGSESDRIAVYLSLHLTDFASDVVMIVMTAVILFSMNPYLALITLVPLPFIGWMIHFVRYRLRTGFEKIDRVWGEVTNVLSDTIPGIRVVKAFAQEQREAARFREANRHNL
ncbi:MAG: ABC transporter, partial [Burkholderiales bacterium PBB4]